MTAARALPVLNPYLVTAVLAERLPGADIRDALLAVRRDEQDHYGQQDAASPADRCRYAWPA